MKKKPEIVRDYARHVSPGKVDLYTKYGLVLVPGRREGIYLYDLDGKRYVNCHSNGGVFNLGHRNARIMRAVERAMKTYDIGNHHLISGPKAALAREIAATMPRGLSQVVYGVSGGEAIDLAIKLARGVTGRADVISATGGYHGHTGFALAAGDVKYREKFGPRPAGFVQIPFNDMTALQKALDHNSAAVIFETIPATMGIVVPDKDYFRRVRRLCDAAGALMILDEVQTGFGRTGRMWGFERFGAMPDIVVLGKGMSGGIYPITATVYHEKYAGFFKGDPFLHISTFGGSEVGCHAAMEVIRISRQTGFLSHVREMGTFFTKGLGALSRRYPALRIKARGMGLMMGIEFMDEATSLLAMKMLFDNGIYLVYSGNDPKVLQFLPPLIVSRRQGEEIMKIMESTFGYMSGG